MLNNVIVRLVVHYTAAILLFAGLFRLFPDIPRYVAEERARGGQAITMDLEATGVEGDIEIGEGISRVADPRVWVPVVIALMAAFLWTLPVVWVYRWTRPRKRYSQAFAHTLLVVPIAIALVVFLVKGSLPLAFSLAGIVAAVRFRTSLNEPMDAVYMFIVIAIGLSAGVQLATVSLIASVAFNLVALGVWRLDFGREPAILSGWRVLRGSEAGQLLGVSGELHPDDPGAVQDTTGKGAYNSTLRVQTTRVEAAQRAVIPVLEANAKNWRIAQVRQNEDGSSTIEFDVRLRKSADLAAFIHEIEHSEADMQNVEFKKYKRKSV